MFRPIKRPQSFPVLGLIAIICSVASSSSASACGMMTSTPPAAQNNVGNVGIANMKAPSVMVQTDFVNRNATGIQQGVCEGDELPGDGLVDNWDPVDDLPIMKKAKSDRDKAKREFDKAKSDLEKKLKNLTEAQRKALKEAEQAEKQAWADHMEAQKQYDRISKGLGDDRDELGKEQAKQNDPTEKSKLSEKDFEDMKKDVNAKQQRFENSKEQRQQASDKSAKATEKLGEARSNAFPGKEARDAYDAEKSNVENSQKALEKADANLEATKASVGRST